MAVQQTSLWTGISVVSRMAKYSKQQILKGW